jgi:predicted RNA-binding Zn-ribbon protein involved in translation (DUF1610 family)
MIDGPSAYNFLSFSCLGLVVRLSAQREKLTSGWKSGGSVGVEKARFSYYCTSCETRHKAVSQGTCPTCGSQAIVSVGWYRRSPDERQEWFQRIRGEARAPSGEAVGPHDPAKKADKTDG